MADFWWRLKAQSIPNFRHLAALATGSEKWFGRLWTRAVSCQLSAPAELQGQKATQNRCKDVIQNLVQEYKYENVVDMVLVLVADVQEPRSSALGADLLINRANKQN